MKIGGYSLYLAKFSTKKQLRGGNRRNQETEEVPLEKRQQGLVEKQEILLEKNKFFEDKDFTEPVYRRR